MSDMTKCDNHECKQSKTCLRFLETPNSFYQSYIMAPKIACELKDYQNYIKAANN